MERALLNKFYDKEYKEIEFPYDELNKKIPLILNEPGHHPIALAVKGAMMRLDVWKDS